MHNTLLRLAAEQLKKEYHQILAQRKISLKPVVIGLFKSDRLCGEYNPTARTICISEKLVLEYSWHQVTGVLQHEMAHQYDHEKFQEIDSSAHGEGFKKACDILGVPHPFRGAKVDIPTHHTDSHSDQFSPSANKQGSKDSAEEQKIIDRVRKLLSLAASSNEHEAFLAMQKVQQLYAKYNYIHYSDATEKSFTHQVYSFSAKKVSLWKKRLVVLLVEHFFVEAFLLNQYNSKKSTDEQCVEIVGLKENVLMAEYVLDFIIRQAEALAESPQFTQPKLKGRLKNSFLYGVIEGFDQKLKTSSQTISSRGPSEEQQITLRALQIFKQDPQLKKYLKIIYPHLRQGRSSKQAFHQESFSAGQVAGTKIQLHKGLHQHKKNIAGYLG